MLREGIEKAVARLDKDLQGPQIKEIRKQAFLSALIGIRKGKMTSEQDPLLPRLLGDIEEFKAKAEKMTEKEQVEALGLTKEQKDVIMSADKKLEEAFIKATPAIKHPKIISSSQFKSLSA